jgi:hypothetical protein
MTESSSDPVFNSLAGELSDGDRPYWFSLVLVQLGIWSADVGRIESKAC